MYFNEATNIHHLATGGNWALLKRFLKSKVKVATRPIAL